MKFLRMNPIGSLPENNPDPDKYLYQTWVNLERADFVQVNQGRLYVMVNGQSYTRTFTDALVLDDILEMLTEETAAFLQEKREQRRAVNKATGEA